MNEPALQSVCPVFQVADLQRAIGFYTRVLGFKTAWTSGTPPDRATVCRDSVEIMLEAVPQPRPSHVYVLAKGIDAYFATVVAGGAAVVYPLADRVYGMRDGRVADPDENHIAFGEALPGAS